MVKQGYKQTEIGVIPEDWDVDTIKSITVSVATGGNYKNSTQISPYPLIKMGNISRGNINVSKIEYVTDTIPSEKDRLIYGDVLFNTRNTPELVGKVAIWKNELPIAYFNSNLLRFNFNLEKSNPFFMNLIFNTEQVISEFKNIAKGTTSVAAIYPQDMLKVLIKIPPLPEQNRIAEALSDVDSMISALEKLIAKKKAVKQGAMQELLTGKKRLPGFTGEWEGYTIGSIAEVGRGRVISHIEIAKNIGGKYPVYSSQTANNGIMGYLRTFDFEGDYITWTTDGVNAGTVFCRSGNFNCTNVCGTLKLKEDNLYFVAKRLSIETPKYVSTNLANPKLMNDVMKKIVITLPPTTEEQAAVASILSDMDNEIEALEQKLDKTRQLKQGMMQQLLTGKIRLV